MVLETLYELVRSSFYCQHFNVPANGLATCLMAFDSDRRYVDVLFCYHKWLGTRSCLAVTLQLMCLNLTASCSATQLGNAVAYVPVTLNLQSSITNVGGMLEIK